MSADWEWDSPEVPDSDSLMRRVKNKPDLIVPNLTTREPNLARGALRVDPHSGISMQSTALLPLTRVRRAQIYDWDQYYGVEFRVADIREPDLVGVVYEPDHTDVRLGDAHALVRNPEPQPDRAAKKRMFQKIVDCCRFMPEDPHVAL